MAPTSTTSTIDSVKLSKDLRDIAAGFDKIHKSSVDLSDVLSKKIGRAHV